MTARGPTHAAFAQGQARELSTLIPQGSRSRGIVQLGTNLEKLRTHEGVTPELDSRVKLALLHILSPGIAIPRDRPVGDKRGEVENIRGEFTPELDSRVKPALLHILSPGIAIPRDRPAGDKRG